MLSTDGLRAAHAGLGELTVQLNDESDASCLGNTLDIVGHWWECWLCLLLSGHPKRHGSPGQWRRGRTGAAGPPGAGL